jgi:hypothetical protein
MFVTTRPGPRHDRYLGGALFTLAMLPGPIAVAAINQHLYESVFSSGYGSVATIYASGHFAPNLVNYATWLLVQTPFIVLGLAAPSVLRRKGESDARRVTALALAFSAVVLLSYLWYTPFDNWTYLRFLLPAFPLMLSLAATVLVLMAPRPALRRALTVTAIVAAFSAWGAWAGRAAFQVQTDEARYLAAGRFAATLPDNAVILSNQHSGSLPICTWRRSSIFSASVVRFTWCWTIGSGTSSGRATHRSPICRGSIARHCFWRGAAFTFTPCHRSRTAEHAGL